MKKNNGLKIVAKKFLAGAKQKDSTNLRKQIEIEQKKIQLKMKYKKMKGGLFNVKEY